jgi:hypothetical protein
LARADRLQDLEQQLELAKDVAARGNALKGCILVIGIATPSEAGPT